MSLENPPPISKNPIYLVIKVVIVNFASLTEPLIEIILYIDWPIYFKINIGTFNAISLQSEHEYKFYLVYYEFHTFPYISQL